ncbi:uncharacterized protein ASCRUDRAFT_80968 [Ascoidea rubescens DSM 1968]|uniref:Uncharacterized protein n=1 Tax=Ascoidea rubescens DSM 1968 TaxID=1344418 RepID=A0A1D2VIE5_9ASCO|nr:hypothetical protein ASCRUDRAFT_80968 [Ascoidea rubescens DSM 1968]ODV61237.1 hypothetical protein ASCRUDRAFT_80968 [Ascoidea rubescens DSM 1968]
MNSWNIILTAFNKLKLINKLLNKSININIISDTDYKIIPNINLNDTSFNITENNLNKKTSINSIRSNGSPINISRSSSLLSKPRHISTYEDGLLINSFNNLEIRNELKKSDSMQLLGNIINNKNNNEEQKYIALAGASFAINNKVNRGNKTIKKSNSMSNHMNHLVGLNEKNKKDNESHDVNSIKDGILNTQNVLNIDKSIEKNKEKNKIEIKKVRFIGVPKYTVNEDIGHKRLKITPLDSKRRGPSFP